MLFADFAAAQEQIRALLKSVRRCLRAPELWVRSMERIEHGPTQVQHRVFVELWLGSDASRVAAQPEAILLGRGYSPDGPGS